MLSPFALQYCIAWCSCGVPMVKIALIRADLSSAISDINHIVAGLPLNTLKIIRHQAACKCPIRCHCRAASKRPFVVEHIYQATSEPPVHHRLQSILAATFTVMRSSSMSGYWSLSHFPVVGLPFSCTRLTPIAFLYGWLPLLATMSDSHSKSLKQFMFVPWPLKAVQVNKQTAKLYPVVDSSMKPPERAHMFQTNKMALSIPGMDRRTMPSCRQAAKLAAAVTLPPSPPPPPYRRCRCRCTSASAAA